MKAYFLSVLTLLAVLSLALWNSASMAGRTQRWQGQLDQVEALANGRGLGRGLSSPGGELRRLVFQPGLSPHRQSS